MQLSGRQTVKPGTLSPGECDVLSGASQHNLLPLPILCMVMRIFMQSRDANYDSVAQRAGGDPSAGSRVRACVACRALHFPQEMNREIPRVQRRKNYAARSMILIRKTRTWPALIPCGHPASYPLFPLHNHAAFIWLCLAALFCTTCVDPVSDFLAPSLIPLLLRPRANSFLPSSLSSCIS